MPKATKRGFNLDSRLGMSKQEISDVSLDTVKAKYDEWRSGAITDEAYELFFLDLLEHYIKKRISMKRRTLGAEFDDLMQEGRMAIIQNYRRYDPYMGIIPSTFFTPYIDNLQRRAVMNDSISRYYQTVILALTKVATANGYTGLNDTTLTPQTLSLLSDYPMRTVITALGLARYSEVSLEKLDDSTHAQLQSPEIAYLKKEKSDTLAKQLKKCTPLEQFVLLTKIENSAPQNSENDTERDLSFTRIANYLRTGDGAQRFSDELPKRVSAAFVERKYNQGLRKLRSSTPLRRVVTLNGTEREASFEQAEEDDFSYLDDEDAMDMQAAY